MFKHILLPVDGSALSDAVVQKTLAFAQGCGALVTAVHVVIDFRVLTFHANMLAETREQYQRDASAHAHMLLAAVGKAARERMVSCTTLVLKGEHPYAAIIEAAREQHCDLICMASHGRHGVQGLLLGSETQKVLAHTQIPVLVYR